MTRCLDNRWLPAGVAHRRDRTSPAGFCSAPSAPAYVAAQSAAAVSELTGAVNSDRHRESFLDRRTGFVCGCECANCRRRSLVLPDVADELHGIRAHETPLTAMRAPFQDVPDLTDGHDGLDAPEPYRSGRYWM